MNKGEFVAIVIGIIIVIVILQKILKKWLSNKVKKVGFVKYIVPQKNDINVYLQELVSFPVASQLLASLA